MLQKLIELNVSDNSRYPWNDNGSGRLFADVYKDIARYVPERKKWYVYDGTRWIPDIGGLKTMELAKSLADKLRHCNRIHALGITDIRVTVIPALPFRRIFQIVLSYTFISNCQGISDQTVRKVCAGKEKVVCV